MIAILLTLFQFVAATGYGHPDYVKSYDKTADRKIKTLFAKEGLTVYGSGGAFCSRISQPMYSVFSSRKLEEKEAVQYYTKIFSQMLSEINNTKEIRFYLFEYPLTDQSLNLRIDFVEKDGQSQSAPYVSSIFNVRGRLIVQYSEKGVVQEDKEVAVPFEIKLSK